MAYIEIELTRGLFAIIDQEDVDRVNTYKWQAHSTHTKGSYYATGRIDGKDCQMANFILNHNPSKSKLVVDHINGNGLDNRKCNLRLVSRTQNNINKKIQKNNTSKITGVRHMKEAYLYIAFWSENKEKQIKCFPYGKKNKDSKEEKRKAKKKRLLNIEKKWKKKSQIMLKHYNIEII